MKLIAITHPYFFEGETNAICRLLDRGWHRVHLRKPESAIEPMARFISSIPEQYYPKISIHDHFELATDFGLGGVHLNNRNPSAPSGWNGLISRSCHSTEEIKRNSHLDYLTLSPVFDSISKPGYLSLFDLENLKELNLERVYALGGVTFDRLAGLKAVGFPGAAMLSDAWKIRNEMLQFITNTETGLEDVLRGGCRWVQLRMKDVSDAEFAQTAKKVMSICRKHDAIIIFDDRVNLVAELGADGVHLGKNDMPVKDARGILGHKKIIGATANTIEDIRNACQAGADYIGLGPFRFTTTKKGLSPILGLDGYRRILAECRQTGICTPIVAIGGITLDDLTDLKSTRVDGVAISGLMLNAQDKEQITKTIIETWKN